MTCRKDYFSKVSGYESGSKTARALLNIPGMVAALVDTDCNIIDANDFMAARFDMAREKLIGKNFLELLPEDIAKRRKQYHDQYHGARA